MKEIIKEGLEKMKITKLAVFDFDGTLIDTPLPDAGKPHYEKTTGKPWPHEGWWSKPESLDTTVFEMPVIKSVLDIYEREKNEPNVLTVMMTGRVTKLAKHVEAILKDKGLTFDRHIYNNGGNTLDSKLKSLEGLLTEYPNVDFVELSDDRLEHIPTFETWCKSKVDSGRIKVYKINVVESGHHDK